MCINAVGLYTIAGLNATYVASGWQFKVVIVNIISSYLVGLPLDFWLTGQYGLKGIWTSTALAMFLRLGLLFLMWLCLLDTRKVTVQAVHRSMDRSKLGNSNVKDKSSSEDVKDNLSKKSLSEDIIEELLSNKLDISSYKGV